MTARLLLDLGNRRLKSARGQAGRCIDVQAHALPGAGAGAAEWAAVESWLAAQHAALGDPVFVSSTRPRALERLRAGCLAGAELRVAGADGWPFEVATTGTGSDRILAARAGWRRAGSTRAVLVADLGSAWTLDVMDGAGTFRGGAIGAGLAAQAAGLLAAAPHLPPAPANARSGVPATTEEALAMGRFGALAAALDGLAARFETALGATGATGAARLVTGGDASCMQSWLGPAWEPAPDLVLEGLARLATGAP
ncbi:MAG TPA: type III pantothenate kinase [Planctomycetota bacterium]